MRPMADRERKLVAVLILIAVLVLVQLIVIGPIVAGFSDRAARRDQLIQQYQVNQRQVASIPQLRRRAERQKADLGEFVIAAPDPAAASIALQERLQASIESLGGELRGTEEVTGDSGLVRARASARMSLDQIARLLARLQNEAPYVTVEALTITADQALISGHLEPMDATVEVSIPFVRAPAR